SPAISFCDNPFDSRSILKLFPKFSFIEPPFPLNAHLLSYLFFGCFESKNEYFQQIFKNSNNQLSILH
ncbi:MAG: hypothetical protein E6295_06650, partial [Streptococcus sp.]|nr:hypothetical protein [Streptococcus sp.]